MGARPVQAGRRGFGARSLCAPPSMTEATVSVVVPVLDGARHLDRLLAAIRAQGDVELLVVDSGSSDGSQSIARRHLAAVASIDRADFQHAATRNLAAERTSGELICFLSQDA